MLPRATRAATPAVRIAERLESAAATPTMIAAVERNTPFSRDSGAP